MSLKWQRRREKKCLRTSEYFCRDSLMGLSYVYVSMDVRRGHGYGTALYKRLRASGYDQSHEHKSSNTTLGAIFVVFYDLASHVALIKLGADRTPSFLSYTGTSLSPSVRCLPAFAVVSFRYPFKRQSCTDAVLVIIPHSCRTFPSKRLCCWYHQSIAVTFRASSFLVTNFL